MPEQRTPEEDDVRRALLRFADLVQRLDREGDLMDTLPFLMGRMGDLRQMLFDYEVRFTERLLPVEDPVERESRRIVREAEERSEEAPAEWELEWRPDQDDGGGALA